MKLAISSNDVRLSLLATRAITGLAQLARAARWDAQIEEDLKKGVVFCESLDTDAEAPVHKKNDQLKVLRKLTANLSTVPRTLYVSQDEIRQNKGYLLGLLQHRQQPKLSELVDSINFFLKATSGRTLPQKKQEELFK